MLQLGENEVEIKFVAGPSSLNRNPEFLYTLFVPDRARTAFPLFDQPDLKSVYRLSLEVPADWKAMSNAPVENITEQGESTLYEFQPSHLKESCLECWRTPFHPADEKVRRSNKTSEWHQ